MAHLACGGFSNIFLLLCILFGAIGTNLGVTYSEEQGSICRQDIVQDRPLNDVANSEAPLQEHSVSKRSTAHVVDIAQFEDSSTPGKQFSVYVDETMTRLMIEVKVDRSNPVMMLTKPTGVPGARPSINTTTGTTFRVVTVDIAITTADYGIWKIMKMDANKWHVKIQGESPLDFTYQFLEGTFIQMPITRDPIQGKSYKTTIQVQEYSEIQKVDMVFLIIIAKATPANMFPPKGLGSGKYSVDKMTMIDQAFMIGIQGKDNSGNIFRRLSSLIKPVTLSLFVPSYAGVKLYENNIITIAFWVVNELSTDQDIDVRIVDTKKWAQAPIFISRTLTPGQNFTGMFAIRGGMPGETTIATISARQYLGHGRGFSLGPTEARQFTVEKNTTKLVSTTSTLSAVQTVISGSMITSGSNFGSTNNTDSSGVPLSKILGMSPLNTIRSVTSRPVVTKGSIAGSTNNIGISNKLGSKKLPVATSSSAPASVTSRSMSTGASTKSTITSSNSNKFPLKTLQVSTSPGGATTAINAAIQSRKKVSTFNSPWFLTSICVECLHTIQNKHL